MTTTFPYPLMPETLSTTRLRLRAPVAADGQRIATFIGDWDVVKMLSRVPHPYREADATSWIASLKRETSATYALVHANGVIGVVGIEQRHDGVAELGYWLAKPFWGRGLMTEAARAVVKAARACAPDAALSCGHFDDNAASKRVIEKLGFVATGVLMDRSVSRDAAVRVVTYRLPTAASAVVRPPALTPA
jgi:[ribosomal protein S5]-alanine N-acetyltransferase